MYLKQIEFAGFKSFAAHTVADLPRGTVVVVGPNGSGKSNIADGLRWVLGEQSARAVRARKPEEVIFAGSAQKQPLGMAEVSLLLDNADGLMAGVPFAEVRVTRRLYRSGESEYLVNNARVRLRDLTQHLLQAQLGPESYCVIGQGSVDELILQRPVERRMAFENAADVRRHQLKLSETRSRMAATEANLQRVQDVLAELTPHVRRLKAQADRAAKATTLRAELNDLLARSYRQRLAVARQAKADADRRRDEATHELEDAERAHGTAQRRLSAFQQQLAALDGKLAEARPRVEACREQVRASERSQAVAEERAAALMGQIATAEQSRDELAARRDTLAAEQREFAALPVESAAGDDLEGQIARLTQELKQSTDGQREREGSAGRARAERNRVGQEQGQADTAIARLEERVQLADTSDAAELSRRGQVEARRAELQQAIASLVSALEATTASAGRADQALSQVKAERTRVERAADAARQAARDLGQQVDRLLATLHALGAGAGAGEAGGPVQRAEWPVDLADLPVLGTADQLARTVRLFDQQLSGYLARILVLRTKAAAATAHARLIEAGALNEAWAVLAADGALISGPSPAPIRATSAGATNPSVSWGQALDAAEAELEAVQANLRDARQAAEQAEAELEMARANEANAVSVAAEARARQAEQQREQAAARSDLARVEQEREREADRQRQSGERNERQRLELQQAQERRTQLRARWQGLSEQITEVEQAAQQSAAQVQRLQQRLSELRDEQRHRRLKAEAQQALRLRVERDVAAAAEGLRQIEDRLARQRGLLAEANGQSRLAAQQAREVNALLAPALAALQALEAARAELVRQRGDLERELDQTRAAERAAHTRHEAVAVQWQQAGDDLERLRQEIEHVLEDETALDSAAPTGEMVLRQLRLALYGNANPEPAVGEMDQEAARRRIATLQRELRAVGAVGDGVADEYREMSERHTFLSQQSHDLQLAMDNLGSAAEELEAVLRERFAGVFESVNAAFQDCFKQLFGGGEAQLVLTEPQDLLQTGVDIVARPPGKKLQGLLSLSGGERALTVVALLFGLLRVNPTPFCVLDEVDAALDESNVQRFAHLLRTFAASIQFIVVTHNRATMDAADALFGVTMDALGVSHLLSVAPTSVARREALV